MDLVEIHYTNWNKSEKQISYDIISYMWRYKIYLQMEIAIESNVMVTKVCNK